MNQVSRFTRIILLLEIIVQTVLGCIMVIMPNFFNRLVYYAEPSVFLQTIGGVALSIALLSLLAYQKQKNTELLIVVCAVLALFNFSLAVFLAIAASSSLVSWLGFIVHAPFAICFAYSTIKLKAPKTNQ